MLARVFSCAVIGLDGVVVEVDTMGGLPKATIVDQPDAVEILIATAQLPPHALDDALVIGELSLDGSVWHVRGVLPMAALARAEGYRGIFVPEADAPEAALIPDLEVIPVPSLAALYDHLTGGVQLSPNADPAPEGPANLIPITDFQEIKGQEQTKRAIKVASAGNHNMLMIVSIG